MYTNMSPLFSRSVRNPLLLNSILSRSYSRANSLAGTGKPAASSAVKNSQNYKPSAQPAKIIGNDLGGQPKHPERSLFEGVKGELRQFKEDVLNEDARRFASQANETAGNISNKVGSAAGAGNAMKNAVKSASSTASASVQNLEAKVKSSLNDVIDVAEDKFGSFREPPAKKPVNPKIDVLAEENINDLLDELEDKVRGMDHVKEAVADPKIRGALGLDDAKKPGTRV